MNRSTDANDIKCLILKVRNGDQQAFVELLDRYQPLLKSLVSKFIDDDLTKANEEDLFQEATLVFYNAILTYDENQCQVEFGLYARICISNALISQLRAINKRKLEHPTEPKSTTLCEQAYSDPVDNIVEEENVRKIYSVIKSNLSNYEYLIWIDYMKGRTAREIGEAVGKNEKSVTNAIYRIRKKLRNLLK